MLIGLNMPEVSGESGDAVETRVLFLKTGPKDVF